MQPASGQYDWLKWVPHKALYGGAIVTKVFSPTMDVYVWEGGGGILEDGCLKQAKDEDKEEKKKNNYGRGRLRFYLGIISTFTQISFFLFRYVFFITNNDLYMYTCTSVL